MIEQMAAEWNIRIVWEKKEITHRDFIGSPGYVKRVMMNILSNAVKYNRENGQIYISCMEIPSKQPEMTTLPKSWLRKWMERLLLKVKKVKGLHL